MEDVLRYRQESVSRPKNVKLLVDQIETAVDDIDFEKAEESLEKLKNTLERRTLSTRDGWHSIRCEADRGVLICCILQKKD